MSGIDHPDCPPLQTSEGEQQLWKELARTLGDPTAGIKTIQDACNASASTLGQVLSLRTEEPDNK